MIDVFKASIDFSVEKNLLTGLGLTMLPIKKSDSSRLSGRERMRVQLLLRLRNMQIEVSADYDSIVAQPGYRCSGPVRLTVQQTVVCSQNKLTPAIGNN